MFQSLFVVEMLAAPFNFLPVSPGPENLLESRRVALLAIERGNARRAEGQMDDAMKAYDEAIALLTPFCGEENSLLRDDLASAWTNRAIAFFNLDDAAHLPEILASLDRAAALRAPLLATGIAGYQYNLSGVWLNRGDALKRLGGPARVPEALQAYEESLRVGQGMERAGLPEFTRRVALTHLNLATTRLGRPGREGAELALPAFAAAAGTLAALGEARTPADYAMASTAWVGHAEAAERLGRWEEAAESARRALAFVRGLEDEHRRAAFAGLRARWILCSLAERGMANHPRAAEAAEAASAATDAAEEGLRIAARWDERGAFQPFILEFFRFGTKSYGWRQPHFLAEFIEEFLPLAKPHSAAEARRRAAQAVAFTLERIADRGPDAVRPGEVEKTLATFRGLRELQVKLAAAEA
jgi:tetratricopeptide (TPR) repeat protein